MIASLFRNGAMLFALQGALFGDSIVALAATRSDSATVALPQDTMVTLVPTGTGGMAGVHNVGDPVDFTVKNPVIVNGWVAIPKGAPAHGVVSDLTTASVNPFSGKVSQASLHFAFEWVQLTTGKLRLDNAPVEVKGRQINRKLGLFKKNVSAGIDPWLTAAEYGVEAKTSSTVHVATSLRATALEQAEQTDDYITK